MQRIKVLAVADYPSPHLSGVFEALGSHPGMRLRVFFTRRENPLRAWGSHPGEYPHEFIPTLNVRALGYNLKFSISLLRRVYREDFDLLLINGAYFDPLTLSLLSLARLKSKLGALFTEPPDRRKRNFLVTALQRLLFKFLKGCTIFTPGARGVDKFMQLTPKTSRIINLPYFIKLEPFAKVTNLRNFSSKKNCIKLLYCGRFVKLKRIDLLFAALQSLVGWKWLLILVGSGPEEAALRLLVPPGQADRVIFLGEAAFVDMPFYYALGDVFIYPGNDDGWGMAVPEALAAGLPVISTYEVSAAVDLIRDGENGFLIQADSEPSLREAILYFLDHPETLPRFSRNAARVMERYNARIIASRFYGAISNLSKNKLTRT